MSGISVGVIGSGYWGRNHLRNFHALNSLAAFCDSDDSVIDGLEGKYPGAKPYTDPEAFFEDPGFDGVVIATPSATHGGLVRRALEAGMNVFVEKPLCLDPGEARSLGALAEKLGLTLMVGHLLLYHPAFRALKGALESGRLGTLRYIYSNRLSLGKIRREENALWSFAPHDLSMILNLTGKMPHSVMTCGGTYLSPTVADTTLAYLNFDDGLQAHIFVSWLHPFKDHKLVIVGSEGMAVFDDVQEGPEKLTLYRHAVGWDGNLPAVSKAVGEPIPYDPKEPLAIECEHFLDCIAEGKRPLSDAAEGLRVLTVLDACQRSLTSGVPEQVSGATEKVGDQRV
jgi:UDP-2-acetamido-3-amino-2,3-dideoxy-glucuronate N-acetyltransferase